MFRRLLPTLSALVLGLAGLGWGLWQLQRIFATEREDARASLRSRREALEQYALVSLSQTLREKLEEARPALELAAADPLAPAHGLYLRERGEQLLPRLTLHDVGEDSPARDRYTRLRAGKEVPEEEEDPWTERLALMRAVERGLERRDARSTTEALVAFLQHRVRYVLASTRDVPGFLVVLEALAERAAPEHLLMQSLLHHGMEDGRGHRLEGLQRLLLLKRSRFTRTDFYFLQERVVELSRRTGTPVIDFEARTAELAATPLPLPGSLPGPVLVRSGWYLEPKDRDHVRGVAVAPSALLDILTREMRERGLLGPEGHVRLLGTEEVLPLASLPLGVETPLWEEEEKALEQRYRLKTGMLVLCAGLALTIAGLALHRQDEHRAVLRHIAAGTPPGNSRWWKLEAGAHLAR